MTSAPLALFVYKRPVHLAKTLESLARNHGAREAELYIFCDGARAEGDKALVEEARKVARAASGFKMIHLTERQENWGLAKSIIAGVSEILSRHSRVIVLEDDLETSPYFLTFMNEGLEAYKDEPRVASIHGYSYFERYGVQRPLFLRGADCLGWATWDRAWKFFDRDAERLERKLKEKNLLRAFDFDNTYDYSGLLRDQVEGRVDSWAICWMASAFLHDLYTLYPPQSLVFHIGNDGSGTNYHITPKDDPLNVPLHMDRIPFEKIPVEMTEEGLRALKKYHSHLRGSFFSKVRGELRRLLRARGFDLFTKKK